MDGYSLSRDLRDGDASLECRGFWEHPAPKLREVAS